MAEIWIEAESLENKGGWVVDSGAAEWIRSAYLMAHGMGIPVADASGRFIVAEDGEYRVFALTRDWTAPWNVKDPAGKFEIRIDGKALPHTLGTNGKDWGFQLAGKIFLTKGTHALALHDLTGFNGRCDAIYITDTEEPPKSSRDAIDAMRKRLVWKEVQDDERVYDLAVVGGGIAGICTALAAKRKGCNVVLINDRPILGGCNSSEIRVCMGGQIGHAPYERIGDVVREIAPVMGHPTVYKEEYFEDHRKRFAFEVPLRNEGTCVLLLNEAVLEIEKEGDRIAAVIATSMQSGKKTRIRATLFSDCSGDGILARLGGAEVMYGNDARSDFGENLAPSEHRNLVMGHSIRWYSEQTEEETAFPDIDWNLHFDEDSYLNCFSGDWEQETGFTRDMVKDAEYIRDYGLRAIYSNWSYQKNHAKSKERFAKSELKWVSPFGGKRESYRVKGDYILTQNDFNVPIDYEDATAKITWGIDIHYPEPINKERFGEAFRSFAYHRHMPFACPVPYRCLYSKDIENLFLGGRLISVSHIAFSAVRVMRTLGMLGEVVGIAASVCKKNGCTPREVYKAHLDELKDGMRTGISIPAAFACNGIGIGESYHFKDLGWFHLHTKIHADNAAEATEASDAQIKKFKFCVEKLGIEHKFPIPEEWK